MAVICSATLSGIALDCSGNVGGIKTVYIANRSDVSSVTVDKNGEVTAITMKSGAKFKEYSLRKNLSSATFTGNVDEQGNVVYENVVNMVFTRMDIANRAEVMALVQTYSILIIQDNNGVYHLLGYDDYTSPMGDSLGETGTARTDVNRYTVTLGESVSHLPYIVDEKIVTDTIIDFNE